MVVNAQRSQSGFTYLAALLLIAVMGAVLASTGTVWHTASQREKERELLYVGNQFRSAIQHYHEQGPGDIKQYPKTFEDLLLDRRHSAVRRHLRKIFVDPMTGTQQWGLLMSEQGGIRGVYSLSEAEAIKTSNFSRQDRDFEGKILVSEWHFAHGASSKPPAAAAADAVDAAGKAAPASPVLPKLPEPPAARQ